MPDHDDPRRESPRAPLDREHSSAQSALPDSSQLTAEIDTTPSPKRDLANRFELLGELGRGGMGVVYLAEDTRLRRKVAIKFLPPEAAHDASRRQRFEQEARAAAKLSHPGIATVHELAEADGQAFIVFEYVPGSTLRSLVKPGGLAREELLAMASDIAAALAAAHGAGVVHRDLKPENVIRTPDGRSKILDFGLARTSVAPAPDAATATLSHLTGAGMVVGTVGYMAPEQLEGKEVDFRSDIFSFGTMLYELATGVHPFQSGGAASTIAAIMTAEPPPLTERNRLQPAELDRIVRKCLRKRREERYQSTLDLAVDLSNLRRDSGDGGLVGAILTPAVEGSEASLFRGLRRFVPTVRRWWEFILLGCLAFLPVGVVLAWMVRKASAIQSGPENVWFTAVLLNTAILAFLRSSVILRAAVSPSTLAQRVVKFAPAVRIFTMTYGALAFLAALLLSVDRYPLAAPLAILFSFGAFLYALIVEPMNNRATFPEAFGVAIQEPPRNVAGVASVLPVTHDDSLLGKAFARLGASPRRWWELHQLFVLFVFSPAAYALGLRSSATISATLNTPLAANWHGLDGVMQSLASSGDLVVTWKNLGLPFFLALILLLVTTVVARLYMVCLAAVIPERLVAEIRRLQTVLAWGYVVMACQFVYSGFLFLRVTGNIVEGAGLAAFGLATLLAVVYIEPVMVRAAFPQAFAEDEKRRLRRTVA